MCFLGYSDVGNVPCNNHYLLLMPGNDQWIPINEVKNGTLLMYKRDNDQYNRLSVCPLEMLPEDAYNYWPLGFVHSSAETAGFHNRPGFIGEPINAKYTVIAPEGQTAIIPYWGTHWCNEACKKGNQKVLELCLVRIKDAEQVGFDVVFHCPGDLIHGIGNMVAGCSTDYGRKVEGGIVLLFAFRCLASRMIVCVNRRCERIRTRTRTYR